MSCESDYKLGPYAPHRGSYVGQTAKTFYERSLKHMHRLRRHKLEGLGFMSCEPPKFAFSVVKKHKDVMSRLMHEAVRIPSRSSMNSKVNPISHRVFDSDIFMGGVLKTHSLKPDLTLSNHYANHTM